MVAVTYHALYTSVNVCLYLWSTQITKITKSGIRYFQKSPTTPQIFTHLYTYFLEGFGFFCVSIPLVRQQRQTNNCEFP